jgi:hypothetical protein
MNRMSLFPYLPFNHENTTLITHVGETLKTKKTLFLYITVSLHFTLDVGLSI